MLCPCLSLCLYPEYHVHHRWVCLMGLYKDSATGAMLEFEDRSPVICGEEEKLSDLLPAVSAAFGAGNFRGIIEFNS